MKKILLIFSSSCLHFDCLRNGKSDVFWRITRESHRNMHSIIGLLERTSSAGPN